MVDSNDIIIGAGALVAVVAAAAIAKGDDAAEQVRQFVVQPVAGTAQSLSDTVTGTGNGSSFAERLANAGVTEAVEVGQDRSGTEVVITDRENQEEFEETAQELEDEVGAIGSGGDPGGVNRIVDAGSGDDDDDDDSGSSDPYDASEDDDDDTDVDSVIDSQQTDNWIDEAQSNPGANLL
jgi:hypothetical protein